jgi:glycosyltransferase involved in cell wall biosynthesis
VHHHLARALVEWPDVEADFLDLPPPTRLRRMVGAPVPGLASLDLDLQPLRAQLALSAAARRDIDRRVAGVDAMHVYTHNVGLLSIAHLRRVPTVVSLDSTNALNAFRLPYRQPTRFTRATVAATVPFERRVYTAARAVVANSEWAASSLRDRYGLEDERLHVFPFGIDAPHFDDPVAPGARGRPALPRVVFVGRQLRRKGGELLRAVHQEHLADRCELVLVTMESVQPGRNLTVIGDLRPGDDRLWSILRSAAVFAFPSTIDAAPNAVLESMAAGLPVVAVNTGAVGEMVEHGRTGLLVAPDDPVALREALTALLDDPARREVMGRAGRLRLDEHYHARVSTARLIGLLREVAGTASS